MTWWDSSGLPCQFWLMKADMRRSMRFHLLVPGGWWATVMARPVWSVSFCSSIFQTIARGDGNDTVHASRSDGADRLVFDAGIAYDQIWLRRTGDDLGVAVIGQQQVVTVENYYASADNHVDRIVAGDGRTLDDAQIGQLVAAMAAFTVPAAGQTTLAADLRLALAPQLAGWH